VEIIDADGAREVGVLEADGLVTAVRFEEPERWFYTKAMRRRQNSASIVTVASDGTRIALGGVAPRPVRATAAEEALAQGDVAKAAELSVEAADPRDDAYASAWYRRRVLPVHVRRALTEE
jgi:carbon-monoxide dehydrogenase medium subunit